MTHINHIMLHNSDKFYFSFVNNMFIVDDKTCSSLGFKAINQLDWLATFSF